MVRGLNLQKMKKDSNVQPSHVSRHSSNEMLGDVFIQMSKKQNPVHIPSFLRIRSLYYPEKREELKRQIWNLIKNDERFTYERTSEIFVTKGLKRNERFLKFYLRENEGSDNLGSYISHLVVRRNIG